jgi:hypothetical protein
MAGRDVTPLMCRFPPALVARIDEARGRVSRTRWLEAAAEAALSEGGSSGPRVEARAARPLPSTPAASPRPPVTVVKRCQAGCSVPAPSHVKRCIRHGLVLR